MSASSIALNRFGLGARPGDGPGDVVSGDPATWVMAQCERFEPRPAVIASAPSTAGVSVGLVAYYAQAKAIRAQLKGGRVVSDWPGLAPTALYEARDLKPTMQLYAFIGGAVSSHFGVDPDRAMAALFPASAKTAAIEGLVRVLR